MDIDHTNIFCFQKTQTAYDTYTHLCNFRSRPGTGQLVNWSVFLPFGLWPFWQLWRLLCSMISEILTVNSQMTNSHPFAFRIESSSIYRYCYPKHLGILVRFSPLFQLSLRCFQILLVEGHQEQPKGHFVYSHLELNHTCSSMTSHLNPVFYKTGISEVFSRN